MTATLFSAINILIKPAESVGNSLTSQEEALLSALQANRRCLLQHLDSDPGFAEIQRLRDEVISESVWFCSELDNDHIWAYVQECLLLLLALTRHLSLELDLFKQTPQPVNRVCTPESAPPLPPDVLSVSQQKTLTTALQFVISLGVCPYLAPGVGVPLGCRSAFGAVVDKLIQNGTNKTLGQQRLLTIINVLLKMTELSSLATVVFTRHLGDLMAALCQLGYQPPKKEKETSEEGKELSADQRNRCRENLKNLLGKVYQPIVIKELLILQGPKSVPVGSSGSSVAQGCTPAWLRRLCGQLLSERLMQPHGVQAVVRAILEGTGADSDWRKCDGVAKILVTCPQQSISTDSYYKQVCPQILDMLHFKDKLTAQRFQRVATTALLVLVQEKSTFAQQYLLAPMFAPLHRCITPSDPGLSQDAVEEWELTQCVDDLFKVCVVGNQPSAPLLTALQEVLSVIFTLFCFTKQNVSHLRGPCQEIMLWYLSQCEQAASLSALRELSGLKQHAHQVAPGFHFCPGSDGGVKLRSRDSCSDEDDALYEKLSGEQWRLECLNELLTQLKESDLPGDFLLDLLQDLTSWAAEADEGDHQDLSEMSLLEVEQSILSRTERQAQRLALLQVLAVMVECLPHTLLLRKPTQVVDFILSLLQRACVGLSDEPSSRCENPVESQTLSMGMGLVATLLSVPQVSSEDYHYMSHLLSPLDTLSKLHPEVFIQELASNLKAVIATHGAYKPDDLSTAHSSLKSDTVQTKQTSKTTNKTSTTSSTHSSSSHAKVPLKQPATSENVSMKPLSDLILEACDPDVPTKAFALRGLTQLVQRRDPETILAHDKILVLFLENLEHEDSFVYLSAIQGLAALADFFPQRILERLLQDFQAGPSLSTSNKHRSLETRLKVGEVLMRATRAMGELTPHLSRPLLGVFLQSTKDPDHSVRASSLSNLGELCERLDYALGPLTQELSTCLTALIKTEKEAEVRRAAVHVIARVLKGLSDKTTQVLADVLLDLYRALKWVVRSDPDSVTVLHAQIALEELDDVMRKFIFPEQKLEKKIVILP
ncbi:transport and Golgi organization protein 6 homolog [Boleophthalmus pectinirostris]|uniref:transport and Golgi organization protein 6 homolog n=1 Tax=Boleophthalmus pectinirostris TaxID=150288 RepID=UPI00242D0608|nr:transport and Golgi organization protein 6 homolog [Boleophthalmus pectinirostris]XP_055011154.1 transport and Golgi organization protein 6 homolog [Boleophthalmus pectinirostris]